MSGCKPSRDQYNKGQRDCERSSAKFSPWLCAPRVERTRRETVSASCSVDNSRSRLFSNGCSPNPPPCLISNGSNANLTLGFFFFYHPFDGAACSQMRPADFKSSTTLEGQLEVFRLLLDNICSVNPRRQSHRPPLPPPPLLNLRFSLRTQRQSCKSNTAASTPANSLGVRHL